MCMLPHKASPVSYAWSLPDPRRYRSRFLPMRWPDLVLDDWAFRGSIQ